VNDAWDRRSIYKRMWGEAEMDTKLYLTIAAIVAIIYGLGFFLIPGYLVLHYGQPPEAHVVLNIRFFGSLLLALGVIQRLARDVNDWTAVRAILIGQVVGDVVGGVTNVWATNEGLLNALAWSSTIVYILLALGPFIACTRARARRPNVR